MPARRITNSVSSRVYESTGLDKPDVETFILAGRSSRMLAATSSCGAVRGTRATKLVTEQCVVAQAYYSRQTKVFHYRFLRARAPAMPPSR